MAIKNFLREEMAMCTTNKVTSWECEGPLGRALGQSGMKT